MLKWLKRVFVSAPELEDDDIVVFVVGPSGSGKSTFVSAVIQAQGQIEVGIGHNLQPHTAKVQAIKCELTLEARTTLGAGERKHIVFVDTPSFLTGVNNKAEGEMSTWLRKSIPKSTRSGTIYMHRIEHDPNMDNSYRIQKQLDVFARSFPEDFAPQAFPGRLHCVFSRVDNPDDRKIQYHKAEFGKQLGSLRPKIIPSWELTWNASTHPNFFVKGDPITAWGAIAALFSYE